MVSAGSRRDAPVFWLHWLGGPNADKLIGARSFREQSEATVTHRDALALRVHVPLIVEHIFERPAIDNCISAIDALSRFQFVRRDGHRAKFDAFNYLSRFGFPFVEGYRNEDIEKAFLLQRS